MKKLLLVLAFFALLLSSCQQKSPEELAKMKGTWQVININCPDILAEKNGEKHIFRYNFADNRVTVPYHEQIKYCRETVKPGWIVEVTAEGDYSLFPPVEYGPAANHPQ